MEPLGNGRSRCRPAVAALRATLAVVGATAAIAVAHSAESAGSAGSPRKAADGVVGVVEYRNADLDHYFITADAAEIAQLDGGALGGAWKRTGESFSAWSIADALQGTDPVCRFFGTDQYRPDGTRIGANGHFYTADPAECAFVKTAWQSVAANGVAYPAWSFESNAFAVRRPVNDICPSGTQAIHRAYNNGAGGEPNHRYSTRRSLLEAMSGWTIEGVVMCGGGSQPSPPVSGSGDSGTCLVPVPGFAGEYRISAGSGLQRRVVTVSGTAAAPVETTTTYTSVGTMRTTTTYEVTYAGRHVDTKHVKEEFTGDEFDLVNELDGAGYQFDLPMREGDVERGFSDIDGTQTMHVAGYTCQGSIGGSFSWIVGFSGMNDVTVPAGKFRACVFVFAPVRNFDAKCGKVTGSGDAADKVTLWWVDGLGVVKSSNPDGDYLVELISYSK